ncbi:hypothetical protein BZA77DRAFT_321670 [Pyronema omphalodes]|nr:hypothetical protein BZA77DRAFT_321670 [Pyronema omphalodes]
MHASTLLLALLPALASAHFSVTYPADRGSNSQTQADSPCGGKNTPSSTRTKWPIAGGQLSFEAGHDEANTAVYLALGNNPVKEDFKIILKNQFLQVGMGTFCGNDLAVPGDLGIKNGDNATIQVVQAGHSGGGLYNCADITFTDAPMRTTQACVNGTGISAQEISTSTHSASASGSAAPAAATTSAKPSSAAESVRVAGGALLAGAVGVAAWLL